MSKIVIELDDIKDSFQHEGKTHVVADKEELQGMVNRYVAQKKELEEYRADITVLREGAAQMLQTLNLVDKTGQLKEDIGVSDLVRLGTKLLTQNKAKTAEQFSFFHKLMPVLKKYGLQQQ